MSASARTRFAGRPPRGDRTDVLLALVPRWFAPGYRAVRRTRDQLPRGKPVAARR